MIPWINFLILIISSVLFTIFYIKSVSPASLEQKIGPSAFNKCATYRLVASVFMMIVGVNYILYFWFPLPLSIAFPWPWAFSALIAVVIVVPSSYVMIRGAKDAGEETMRPKREHEMYGGIYDWIRHPQAVAELGLWWVIAFAMHSPFLVVFTFCMSLFGITFVLRKKKIYSFVTVPCTRNIAKGLDFGYPNVRILIRLVKKII